MSFRLPTLLITALGVAVGLSATPSAFGFSQLRKERDLIIYEHPRFHSAFPSVVQSPSGELLLAFRRAPNRKAFGEEKNNHVDPNSQLMLVRSQDGVNWTTPPSSMHTQSEGRRIPACCR